MFPGCLRSIGLFYLSISFSLQANKSRFSDSFVIASSLAFAAIPELNKEIESKSLLQIWQSLVCCISVLFFSIFASHQERLLFAISTLILLSFSKILTINTASSPL